jgi:integrase
LDALTWARENGPRKYVNPYRYATLTTMARTGLRLGEALALQSEDLHFRAGEIRVARGIWRDRLDTLKSRHDRTVDISLQLARSCASRSN